MRKLILILVALSNVQAFAASRELLLYLEFKTGFGDSTYTGLFDDGTVWRWQGGDLYPSANAQLLTRENLPIVNSVKAEVALLPQSLILSDPTPSKASCANSVVSYVGAVRTGHHVVLLSNEVGCHEFVPTGSNGATKLLLEMKSLENSLRSQ